MKKAVNIFIVGLLLLNSFANVFASEYIDIEENLRNQILTLEDELKYKESLLYDLNEEHNNLINYKNVSIYSFSSHLDMNNSEPVTKTPMRLINDNPFPIHFEIFISFDDNYSFAPEIIYEPYEESEFFLFNKEDTQKYASLGIEYYNSREWLNNKYDSIYLTLDSNEVLDLNLLIGTGFSFVQATDFSILVDVYTIKPDESIINNIYSQILELTDDIEALKRDIYNHYSGLDVIIQGKNNAINELNNMENNSYNSEEDNINQQEEEIYEEFEAFKETNTIKIIDEVQVNFNEDDMDSRPFD